MPDILILQGVLRGDTGYGDIPAAASRRMADADIVIAMDSDGSITRLLKHRDIVEPCNVEVMNFDAIATFEEIARVRRQECVELGHDFDIVRTWGDSNPAGICCSRCGKTWGVTEEPRTAAGSLD